MFDVVDASLARSVVSKSHVGLAIASPSCRGNGFVYYRVFSRDVRSFCVEPLNESDTKPANIPKPI